METNLSKLRRVHAEERKSLLNKRRMERELLSIRHQSRMQESRLVNADSIRRSAALIENAKELTMFTLNYIKEWQDMEQRHVDEMEALAKKLHKL
jgi:hypothetical protein